MDDIKTSMRAKDSLRLDVLKSIKSDMVYAEKAVLLPNSSANSIAKPLDIIRRAIRRREESVRTFTEANRSDLAEKEQVEINILTDYLPAPMTPEEILTSIQYVVESELKEDLLQVQPGRRKGWLMSKLGDKIDPARAAKKDILDGVGSYLATL
jgi:uncharacterized protein YqeY